MITGALSASERVHVRAERVHLRAERVLSSSKLYMTLYTFELDWTAVEGVPSSEASNLYEHCPREFLKSLKNHENPQNHGLGTLCCYFWGGVKCMGPYLRD